MEIFKARNPPRRISVWGDFPWEISGKGILQGEFTPGGGHDGVRTRNPRIDNPVLSQLSYAARGRMAGRTGIEPVFSVRKTDVLTARRTPLMTVWISASMKACNSFFRCFSMLYDASSTAYPAPKQAD
jgi:hypothetical protein